MFTPAVEFNNTEHTILLNIRVYVTASVRELVNFGLTLRVSFGLTTGRWALLGEEDALKGRKV